MVSKRFTEEFKLAAIKQITERHFFRCRSVSKARCFNTQSLCMGEEIQSTCASENSC